MRLRTTFLWSVIGSLCLAALLGIVALLLPDLIGEDEKVLGSTLLFAIYSLLALCCAIVVEKRRLVSMMWVGIASSAIGLLIWLVFIWFESSLQWQTEEIFVKAAGTSTNIAVTITLWGLLALLRLDGHGANNLRRATIGVTVLLSLCLTILYWWFEWIDNYIDDDTIVRLMGVLGILSACGTVVTPIVCKVQSLRRDNAGETLPMRIHVEIVCPRCKTHQRLLVGPNKCQNCKLRISINVQEPRCACGYQLYHLESNNCPECGKLIPETDRWAEITNESDTTKTEVEQS